MDFEYGCSVRGQQTVLYRGYEYCKQRENKSGTISWRCCKSQSEKCKAVVITDGSRIVSEHQLEHTHGGNSSVALARKAVGDMKELMSNVSMTPGTSMASVLVQLPNEVLTAIPEKSLIKRTLQRKRQKIQRMENNGISIPAAPKDILFDLPKYYYDMVLYDSGTGEDRVILLGCDELLDGLARASLWMADGTFKVAPQICFQLYSIHFAAGAGANPAAVYCLLTNKTEQTYERVLRELLKRIPSAAPSSILTDFERAAMNAFKKVFPQTDITGCYFHLCQSVIRKTTEIGMKTIYEQDENIRLYIRSLPALAFVPIEDVGEAFDILAEAKPDHEKMDELLTFFEHMYIRGRRLRGREEAYGAAMYPIQTWNKRSSGSDGVARTNNSIEGWHYGLQTLFHCHHPSLWNFLKGLRGDMEMQRSMFLQANAGILRPSKTKYRQINERLSRAVDSYERAETLVYLRSIAHLSFS